MQLGECWVRKCEWMRDVKITSANISLNHADDGNDDYISCNQTGKQTAGQSGV